MTLAAHRHALPKSASSAGQVDAKSSVRRKKDDLRGKPFAEQEAALVPAENAPQTNKAKPRTRAPFGTVAHEQAHEGAISAVPSAETLAIGQAILESDDPALAPYKVLTLYEVVSLYRYSTNDAYPINRVLRGIDTRQRPVATFRR